MINNIIKQLEVCYKNTNDKYYERNFVENYGEAKDIFNSLIDGYDEVYIDLFTGTAENEDDSVYESSDLKICTLKSNVKQHGGKQ